MRILLIEDEPKTIVSVKKGLEENAYTVDATTDGKTGKHLAFRNSYDLIISDIIMPGLSGLELWREIRKAKINTPILLLTALSSTDDVVTGLDSGADDYLAKPFEFKELLARTRALTKRKGDIQWDSTLVYEDLSLDTETKVVKRAGNIIRLTAKEFALLEHFMRNPERTLSKAELARHVWGIDFDTGTNMVEVYVNYLRNKMDRDFDTRLIHTHFGLGYILKKA